MNINVAIKGRERLTKPFEERLKKEKFINTNRGEIYFSINLMFPVGRVYLTDDEEVEKYDVNDLIICFGVKSIMSGKSVLRFDINNCNMKIILLELARTLLKDKTIELVHKVVVLGDVDKTDWIKQLTSGEVNQNGIPTKILRTGKYQMIFNIWESNKLDQEILKDAHVIILVGLLGHYTNLNVWLKNIQLYNPNIPVVVCSNNTPLGEGMLAKELLVKADAISFFNTSCDTNIDGPLIEARNILINPNFKNDNIIGKDLISMVDSENQKVESVVPNYIEKSSVEKIEVKKFTYTVIPGEMVMKTIYETVKKCDFIKQKNVNYISLNSETVLKVSHEFFRLDEVVDF